MIMIQLFFQALWLPQLIHVCQATTLQSWTEATAVLSSSQRFVHAVYSDDPYYSYPECIFVFGGLTTDEMYCYNLTSDEMI